MGSAAIHIDPSVHERDSDERLGELVVQPLGALLRQIAEAIGAAEIETSDSPTSPLLAFDAALRDPAVALRDEAARMIAAVRTVHASESWAIIEWSELALRAIAKIGWAAQSALGLAVDPAPTEQRSSLAARRAVATFRDAVLREVRPKQRHAYISTALSVLLGRPGYRALDVAHRRDLRSLQDQLRRDLDAAALATAQLEASQIARRITLDLSLRPELEAHDLALLEAMTPRIVMAAPNAPIEARDWEALGGLRGLSEVFDQYLVEGEHSAATVAPLLTMLLKRQRAVPALTTPAHGGSRKKGTE